jgi:IstB-like ATP binding protein
LIPSSLANCPAVNSLSRHRSTRFPILPDSFFLARPSSVLDTYAPSPVMSATRLTGRIPYSNRYADLLFEVVTRRYDARKSIFVSTNKSFTDWAEVFPHAACTVTLVDRLVHRSEIKRIGIQRPPIQQRSACCSPAARKIEGSSRDAV